MCTCMCVSTHVCIYLVFAPDRYLLLLPHVSSSVLWKPSARWLFTKWSCPLLLKGDYDRSFSDLPQFPFSVLVTVSLFTSNLTAFAKSQSRVLLFFPFPVLVSSFHLFLTWSFLFKNFLSCMSLHFVCVVLAFPFLLAQLVPLHPSVFPSSSVCWIQPRHGVPESRSWASLPTLLSVMSHGKIEIAPYSRIFYMREISTWYNSDLPFTP